MTATAFVPAFVHPPVYSPWFTLANQQPWEPGVYEVATSRAAHTYYAYWDGAGFLGARSSVADAEAFGREFGPSLMLIKHWRGIVPPSRLPLYVSETWAESKARVPAIEAFDHLPVGSSIAEVCCLLDCMPGYQLLQVLPVQPGVVVNLFRRRDPS